MSDKTLTAQAVLKEQCEAAGLEAVGVSVDGGVIVAADLDTARAAGVGRLVPVQPGLTIVYGKRP